ncbi:MAG: queuosine precursor transporter [Roseovarius sp.]|nr:queuosine precursor transporter [Roseovarius sp.]
MHRGIYFGIAAMAALIVASNVLVQFRFGDWLTLGAFTYPFAFLITDLTNRIFGPSAARKVVYSGFAIGALCSAIGTQIMLEHGPAVTYRIALGSAIAFMTAQLIDVVVFDRLRKTAWWHAPLVSSLIGSAVDTALFFFIAFSTALTFIEPDNSASWAAELVPVLGTGPDAPLWISLAAADFAVKVALALVALVPMRFFSKLWRDAIA